MGRASRDRGVDARSGARDAPTTTSPTRRPPTAFRTGTPGAPGLAALGDWGGRAADPFNDHRAGGQLRRRDRGAGPAAARRASWPRAAEDGSAYEQAGLRTLDTLFDPAGPYLATDPAHEGLLLHSVYHWPNGWDHVPAGARTPRGESSQWGDYHAREAALYVRRLARGEPYLTFFGPPDRPSKIAAECKMQTFASTVPVHLHSGCLFHHAASSRPDWHDHHA